MSVKIENWRLIIHPFHGEPVLQGNVTGHSHVLDDAGHRATTSPVRSVRGRKVVTESGTIYELGTPEPEYKAWCLAQGLQWNDDQPIQVKAVVTTKQAQPYEL